MIQVLPKECDAKPNHVDQNVIDDDASEDDEPSTTNWDDDDDDDAAIAPPSFPEFHGTLLDSIEDLGGSVFPKLNWSSPRDAAWIGFGSSLRCSSPDQVSSCRHMAPREMSGR